MMKTIFNRCTHMLVGMLLVLSACTQVEYIEPVTPSEKMALSLSLPGMQLSRVLTESNESRIDWVDVFIVQEDVIIHNERLTPDGQNKVYLSKEKSEFVDKTFAVYVIANSNKENYADITTLTQLKLVTEQTLFYDASADKTPDHFLMDGKNTDYAMNAWTGGEAIPVKLSRAAAKIVVTIDYEEETVDGYTYSYTPVGVLQKRIINYATTAWVLDQDKVFSRDGENEISLPVGDRKLMDMSEYVNVANVENNASCYFYSYPHTWNITADDSEQGFWNTTALYLNIPVIETKTPVNGTGQPTTETYLNNYYRISLNGFISANSEDNFLHRNHVYRIHAQLKAHGTATPDTPMELKNCTYTVEDWMDVNIELGGKDNAQFLVVNKNNFDFRDKNEDSSLEFTSSSPVTVTLLEAYYVDKVGVKRYWVRDDGGTVNYQEDKNNNNTGIIKFPIEEYKPEFIPSDGKSGSITINSTLLVNTPKYMKIEVKNETGQFKIVTITQYPLDYITPVLGFQSYRTDFGGTHFNQYKNGGIVTAKFGNGTNLWTLTTYDPNSFFSSKVRQNYNTTTGLSKIYRYSWDNTTAATATVEDDTELSNPNMYHVRITAASSDYTLGVPLVDENGYTVNTEENSNMVSPSFMIASLLGFVKNYVTGAVNATRAKDHCANYVETAIDKDGTEIVYTGWRMPTEAELNIIKTYQSASKGSMQGILPRRYYFGVNGITTGADECRVTIIATDDDTNTYLRCVRDVKPDDTFPSRD